MTLESDLAWSPTHLECTYKTLLLRVASTDSPLRWKWFVAERSKVLREPRWWNASRGKGASAALAFGYSSSREKACEDAIAMAKAILKKPPK